MRLSTPRLSLLALLVATLTVGQASRLPRLAATMPFKKTPLPRGGGGSGSKVDTTDKSTEKLTSIDLAIAGGIATAFGDLFMHPVDTIKTVQQASIKGMSIPAAARKIIKDMGWLGFYSGVGPYVTTDGLSGAVKFAVYEAGKKFLGPLLPPSLIGYSHFVCAAAGFVACSVILVPGELIKQRLQAGVATSMVSGFQQILKEKGPMGLYTGYKATLIRDVPYTMLELGLYENFKSILRRFQQRNELTQSEEIAAAALTGGIVGLVTNPLDLVKTRLMTGSTYNGFFDVVGKMYRDEGGVKAFLSGADARVMWLLPFTVIQLGLYEVIKKTITARKTEPEKKVK